MAGPVPQSRELVKLKGNPGKRPLSPQTTVVESSEPLTCPDYVKGQARREWTRICKELSTLGILASADRAVLTAYCLAWGEYDDACRDIAENGAVFRMEENGYEQVRPIVKVRNQAEAKLLKYAKELGLSPSARSKVKVPPKKPQLDPMAVLIAGRN